MSLVKKGGSPFSKGSAVLPKEPEEARPKPKKPFKENKSQPPKRDSEELREIKQILAKNKESAE
jgi:hypothetical protein